MALICPTITATNESDYEEQIANVKAFASHIHIDLMDGQLARTSSPQISKVWWPDNMLADIHLMYKYPLDALDGLLALKPHMVIIHAESDVNHLQFTTSLKQAAIKVGLALLQDTTIKSIEQLLPMYDQLLIFSGHLGYHGGQADLKLLAKVKEAQQLKKELQIAWDGGVNDQNAQSLVAGGVDVLNVGGFIQNSPDPKGSYDKIQASLR